MKRNSIYRILSIGALTLALTGLNSCTAENELEMPDQPTVNQEESNLVSVTLNVSVPTDKSTRSGTTEEGTSGLPDEDGKKNENTINNATLFFYEKLADGVEETGVTIFGNRFKFLAELTAKKIDRGIESGRYTVMAEASPDTLRHLAGKMVYIFVAANYAPNPYDNTKPAYYSFTSNNQAGDVYGKDPRYAEITWNHLNLLEDFGDDGLGQVVPMSNRDFFTVNMESLEDDPDDEQFLQNILRIINERKELNLSDLNNINNVKADCLELERSVARVDYRPSKGKSTYGDNVYQIGTIENLYGQIVDMQMFNIRNNSLLFRQTASGNYSQADFITGVDDHINFFKRNDCYLFGKENGGGTGTITDSEGGEETYPLYNWILDQNWNAKVYSKNGTHGTSNHPVIVQAENRDTLAFIIQGNDGLINLSNLASRTTKDSEGFIPWRYITENTVPSTDLMIMHYTSGIAINVMLCDSTGTTHLTPNDFYLETTGEDEEDLIPSAGGDAKVLDDGDDEGDTGSAPADPNEGKVLGSLERVDNTDYYKLTIGDKSVYAKARKDENGDITGYYLTYWYFFRHNYNPQTHVLGITDPMQYAVVRNNIYKLSVQGFNGLPRPYDPNEPDEPEPSDYIIAMEIRVLPWVKHNITVVF